MPPRHLIVGGGTAGLNAIRTIREHDSGASEIVLVSAERPYARMVLPYYLGGQISESRVFTATPARLAALRVQVRTGRRALGLDIAANRLRLSDGVLEYDDLLIATGSRPVKPDIPGAEGPAVHSFWTLEQARALVAAIREGAEVVLVGAGFIAFTILNAILALKARLTIVETAPRLLPRMIDDEAAALVAAWLRRRGVALRTGSALAAIEQVGGRARLRLADGETLAAGIVIMATGIQPNIQWLGGSGLRLNRGILVDDHLRASARNVYAAGDVAEGPDVVTGQAAVHAIEPTAMEHGRVAGANMAGRDVRYAGSLLMNIVEACGLDIASFGAWEDADAEVAVASRPERFAYRKLLWRGDRLVGAILVGRSIDVWTTNDLGMLKGLTQAGHGLGRWKAVLCRSPFDLKPAFVGAGSTGRLLPITVLGKPSVAPDEVKAG